MASQRIAINSLFLGVNDLCTTGV